MRNVRRGFLLALAWAGALLASPLPDEGHRREALLHYRAGEQHMQAESFEEAVAEFKQAVALDPQLMIAHYNLGQAYMALKRYVEAAAAYQGCRQAIERLNGLNQRERQAMARDNEDEISELKHSIVRIRAGQIRGVGEQQVIRIEERIRLLENTRLKGAEGIKIPAQVPLALGSAYFRQGRLEDAEREYLSALRTDKKLGAAHNNLAVIYLMTSRYPQAREAIKAAEKWGFKVNPQLKADLEARESAR